MLAQANAIHHALERFFGLRVEEREPAAEMLNRALRSVWRQHATPGTFLTTEEEADYGHAALAMLTAFSERFDTRIVPIAREQWVSARLPNGTEVFGKVDRIDRRDSGLLEVVDYKTGRLRLDEDDLPHEPALQVYLLGTEAAASGFEVARLRLIYLASGEERRWDPEREDVERARQRLLDVTDQIAADRSFGPTPGEQCRRCQFRLVCPDSDRVELHELLPEQEIPF